MLVKRRIGRGRLGEILQETPEIAFDTTRAVFFNPKTGAVYGAEPPPGGWPISWYGGAAGEVVAGYGPGWVARTAAEAAELKAVTEAQLAAQAAGQAVPSLPAFWWERTQAPEASAARITATAPAGMPTVVEAPPPPAATGAQAVIDTITHWLSGQTWGLPNIALAAGGGLAAWFLLRGGGGRRRGGF